MAQDAGRHDRGKLYQLFCGLPLGSEGPSVLIGTSFGHLTGKAAKNKEAWNRYVMTGGACAGFSVATGSPVTAILFALEEVHKRFTPMLVIIASTSVAFATYINNLLCRAFGINPVLFDIGEITPLDITDTGYVVLLAVIVAAAVALFDLAVSAFNAFMKKFGSRVPDFARLATVFLLTGVLGLFSSTAFTAGAASFSIF